MTAKRGVREVMPWPSGVPVIRADPGKELANMKKIKIGLVAVASPVESGGERGADLLARAQKAITEAGMDVAVYPDVIWDAPAAIEACMKLKEEKVNSLVVMDITWVVDSMKYIFTTQLGSTLYGDIFHRLYPALRIHPQSDGIYL